MRSPRSTVLAALLVALLGEACGGVEEERRPNVVLLVLDTVRADHLSCYGYVRPTSPRIDALAAISDRYARVESTAPWTLPSHVSMFTGRFPFQHGADSGRLSDGSVHDGRPLAPSNPTLAEALSACGYLTAGFVANYVYLSETFGVHRGFQVYEVELLDAPGMNAKLFAWLDAVPPGQPFFAFVNYMDAHRPYNTDPLPSERPAGLPVLAPDPMPTSALLRELSEQVLGRGENADPALLERIVSRYDNGIAWLDLAVGAVVDELAARDLWEDTLLIVTSDHGEYFGEHGLVEHSKDLYQPVIAVPLICKRPGQTQGRVIERRTSLANVPDLVFAHLPRALRERHGAAFPRDDAERPVIAEVHFTRPKDMQKPWGARFLRERTALYKGRYKLILSTDGEDELFDLEADPGELQNLLAQQPELVASLERELRAILESGPFPGTEVEPAELSPQQLDELRELGYF
jgi:arylsulfatase A-like enzyme